MVAMKHKKKTALALASLIFSFFFWFPLLSLFTSVTALTLGIVALIKISNNPELNGGKVMAISGIVLSGVGIILLPFTALFTFMVLPGFLQTKVTANERAVQDTMRKVMAVCQMERRDQGDYPVDAQELATAYPAYVDSIIFDEYGKYGYFFKYVSNSTDRYIFSAQPTQGRKSGMRYFIADQSGRIFIDGDRNGIIEGPRDVLLGSK